MYGVSVSHFLCSCGMPGFHLINKLMESIMLDWLSKALVVSGYLLSPYIEIKALLLDGSPFTCMFEVRFSSST